MNSDTTTPAAIVQALYECISGPAGQERQWAREAALLHADARLMRSGLDEHGAPFLKVLDAQEYRLNTEPFFAENDFWEIEIDRREWRFGNIAHVLSLYEARTDPDDPVPERRGINSIQLFDDGQRWWVLSVLWDNERPGLKAQLEHR
jgi:hypothetical protein